jgi:hypothetical protein
MSCLGVWKRDYSLRLQAGRALFICKATGMSRKQYILICALSALCLILAVEEQRLAEQSRIWQTQAASFQARINGGLRNRLGPQKIDALFQDLANASLKNSQIRQWLVEQGISVNYTPPSATGPPGSGASKAQP